MNNPVYSRVVNNFMQPQIISGFPLSDKSWNVLELCKMSWKILEINEFREIALELEFGMMIVVPFL